MLSKTFPMKDDLGDIDNNFNIPEEELDALEYDPFGSPFSKECESLPPNISRLIVWLINNYPNALLEELLERGFPWPKDVPRKSSVFVSQDDTQGHISGFWISVSPDNDKWLDMDMQGFDDKKRFSMSGALRFRNGMVGGTSSPRMNPALQILLFACLKDGISKDGYIIDPETGRPLGWGEMREMKREE